MKQLTFDNRVLPIGTDDVTVSLEIRNQFWNSKDGKHTHPYLLVIDHSKSQKTRFLDVHSHYRSRLILILINTFALDIRFSWEEHTPYAGDFWAKVEVPGRIHRLITFLAKGPNMSRKGYEELRDLLNKGDFWRFELFVTARGITCALTR